MKEINKQKQINKTKERLTSLKIIKVELESESSSLFLYSDTTAIVHISQERIKALLDLFVETQSELRASKWAFPEVCSVILTAAFYSLFTTK